MSKATVVCGWDDVPHLSAKTKAELLASFRPHQRQARSRGVPVMGAGAIYPLDESEFKFKPFQMPAYWPRVYGLDVGWNRTAAPWAAWDREADIVYLYAEWYRGEAEPSVHAAAIRAKGVWIPGVIDPAARGRGQKDGEQLLKLYKDLGLELSVADNAVEAGIYAVWERLSTGRLKVCETLENWWAEFRMYRRNEKGAIVKENDHLMDATRYLIMSGLPLAKTRPVPVAARKPGKNTYR